ncbi:PfkB family carbohydrate kinase [Cryomorphaceae bacterium 1068]|nr:PfkB family carbohydrate kinase [Cryomorphaceae bacterium 1068]
MSLEDKINSFSEAVKDFKVCVIGETIVDKFIEVKYEGQSMKSFCPVFRYAHQDGRSREQQGGASAIANHLRDFVKQVDVFTNTGNEIVKTRLIDADDAKKHVEINKFDQGNFGPLEVNTHDYDVVIVADFGHGFCNELKVNGRYHYMTQTNSNNYGYNRMSKWKSFPKKSACMDLREASLQVNRKTDFSSRDAIRELYNYEIGADKLFLTLGKRGSVYYDGSSYVHQDVFKGQIVDTIGAGDTFYAFACLAAELKFEDVNDVMTVPSLAASLSCTWLCNEEEVTLEKLKKHAAQFI